MTKISYTNRFGTFTIELDEDVEYFPDVVDHLLRPLMLAVGFQPGTLDEYLEGQ